jgi:pilus assembly protein Flp/PilA
MQAIEHQLRCFVANEDGATAIEYAVIASGVACAIAGVVSNLGSAVTHLWTSVRDALG